MMMKTIACCILILLSGNIAFAQNEKGEINTALLPQISTAHYMPEYTIDVSTDPAAWAKEKPGIHAAFGSADILYFRAEVPSIKNETALWEATGWKGERLNTQVVLLKMMVLIL